MPKKRRATDNIVAAGDVSKRVGVEQIRMREVDVDKLVNLLIDAAGAEYTTYFYYTILRINLAGNEDYKEICEDAQPSSRTEAAGAPNLKRKEGALAIPRWFAHTSSGSTAP